MDNTQQLEVFRDVLYEIREDISWAVRNDRVVTLPVVCHECSVVRKLPVDPTSVDWGSRLDIHRSRAPQRESEQGIAVVTRSVESVIDQVATATIGLAWVRDEVSQAVQPEAEKAETQLAQSSVSDRDLPTNPHVSLNGCPVSFLSRAVVR